MNVTRFLCFVALLSILGFSTEAKADPATAVLDLKARVQKACEQRDLNALKACFDLDGASSTSIDLSLSPWQEYWNTNGGARWSFDKIEYASLAQLKSDKTINWKAIETMTQSQKMGDHMYAPNLKVIGFITARFKDSNGSNVGTMAPVGLTEDGTAKIASQRLAQ